MRRSALIAAGAAAVLVGAFVAGRYSAPARVEERTRVEWRTVYQIVKDERLVRVEGPVREVERRVEVPGPAGPTVTVERVVERGPVTVTHDLRLASSLVAEGDSQSETVTTRGAPGWRVSAAADPLRLSLEAASFRFGVERRLFGPLWAGVSYQHGGAVLVSLAGEW